MLATIKSTGETVRVTGNSGDYYRVFVNCGGNMFHDWCHKDDLVFRSEK